MVSRVCVIGAGIIGLCCARELRARGCDVVVVDPGIHEAAASRSNAGALAYSEVVPLASPGILRKAPGWLLDPTGPLAIRPGHLPAYAPWLWRFWRASRRRAVSRSAAALASINRFSAELAPGLYAAAGLSAALHRVGALHLYETEAEFRRARDGWELRARHGIAFRPIDGADLRDREPELSPAFTRAMLVEDWILVSDPFEVVTAIASLCRESGVTFRRGAVRDLADEGGRIGLILEGGETCVADAAVIAAGAWSGALAATCGDSLPLEAERGYNTTIPNPNVRLRGELIFGEHGFVVSPLEVGLRIGGAAEFAGLDAPPNYARAAAMLAKTMRFLPRLRAEGGIQWMGMRPSLPDSLPVIGRARHRRAVFYAFGHGHLGLTQAPATGRLIAELVCGQPPAIDLEPFRAARFRAR